MIKKYSYTHVIAWFFAIVIPHVLQQVGVINTDDWVISKENGIISILTGTFLHGNWGHMTANLAGMLVGSTVLNTMYNRMYWPVVLLGILIPSTLMYLGGTPSLGISGLAYALMWFIIFRGLMSRDYYRLGLGIILAAFYGGTLKGAFPLGPMSRIAWEAHLAGLGVGMAAAIWSRLKRHEPVK